MIFKQYEAIIRGLKTQTRRTSEKDTYKVGHVYSVVPKRARPTIWYMFPTDKYDKPLDSICYAHDTYTDSSKRMTLWESAQTEIFTADKLPHPESHLRNMGFKPLRIRILSKQWEPLHYMSEDSAIKEGIKSKPSYDINGQRITVYTHDLTRTFFFTAVEAYSDLWDMINGKSPTLRWDANPLVCVHRFELVEA